MIVMNAVNQNKNSSINWNEALKRANNRSSIAKELLSMLVAELPQTKQAINTAASAADPSGLRDIIHKLHGGASYCGVTRLKELCISLESNLKNEASLEDEEIVELLQKIDVEIDNVLQDAAHYL